MKRISYIIIAVIFATSINTKAHGMYNVLKTGIRGIYCASSIALAYSSYIETVDIKKQRGSVLPSMQAGNTNNALTCTASTLGIVGTMQLLCKQALKRNTPILIACAASDVVARFVQNNYAKPSLPHYERAQKEIANFCTTIQNKIC